MSVSDILGLIKAVLKSHLATTLTRSYATTALMKIVCRLQQGQAECKGLLGSFTENLIHNQILKGRKDGQHRYFVTSLSLELQQRSCEYMSLFEDQRQDLQRQALARMPAMKTAPFRLSLSPLICISRKHFSTSHQVMTRRVWIVPAVRA